MSKSKRTSLLCIIIIVIALLITLLFVNGEKLGITAVTPNQPYVETLFDTSAVHTLDIIVSEDTWQEMLTNASAKEYINCDVVIDGETVSSVGLRTKGNSSLSSIVSSDSDRYSFKLEFDHYVSGQTYYGLDKLALNNIAQDNTYMKDYISYQLMNSFDVDSPLCSFIYITINGDDWGLYLAVEGIEEAFAERNYGSNYGEIYKPDSMQMNMGNREDGSAEDMPQGFDAEGFDPENFNFEDFNPEDFNPEDFTPPDDTIADSSSDSAADTDMANRPTSPAATEEGESANSAWGGAMAGGGMGGFGGNTSDVALVYTDDEHSSYSNIFDNAVFSPSDEDKDRLIASLQQLNKGENLEEVVNIEEVLRYFVVHNFVLNFDSYTGSMTHNYYLYEEDGQLSMIAWDYNLSFGAFSMGNMTSGTDVDNATSLVNYPIDTPISGTTLEQRPLLGQLLADEEYMAQYHELFAEFISEVFESNDFALLIDLAIELISPYVESDPTSFCTYEEFQTASDTLREFCLLRAESISSQLAGTIPTTSAGQSADSSSLIDASHLDINSMGSNTGGFNRARGSMFGRDATETEDLQGTEDNSVDATDNRERQIPPDMQNMPDKSSENTVGGDDAPEGAEPDS